MQYESFKTVSSQSVEGVSFKIFRMSFGRRMELIRRVRELSQKAGFLASGERQEDQVDAALLSREVERLYVEWGLTEIRGLVIDGVDATPETLLSNGPESLCREIVEAIKAECGLSEDERKN